VHDFGTYGLLNQHGICADCKMQKHSMFTVV
jgi:hypothetical protein